MVGSKLLFHPHILPQPGGLLMSSPLCPQEENQKLAEGWGQCIESSDAFDASHPHFVLSPAPPLSVLRRGLEAASCSSTERRLPPPCKSLQRMSEGQKFSTPWVHSISQVAALGMPERKGPGRWDGLWPVHSRPAVPFVTLHFHLPSRVWRGHQGPLFYCSVFPTVWHQKGILYDAYAFAKVIPGEIPDLCKGSLEKHCLFPTEGQLSCLEVQGLVQGHMWVEWSRRPLPVLLYK